MDDLWWWWKSTIAPIIPAGDEADWGPVEVLRALLHSCLYVLPFTMACSIGGQLLAAGARSLGLL